MTSSPCTGLCTLDAEAATCIGCGRSLDQIAIWPMLSEAERRAIMRDLATRGAPRSLHAKPVSR